MTVMQDDDLDQLLDIAARTVPQPSDALMQRVLDDALALQPRAPALRPVAPPARAGLFARLVGMVGGGPTLAGLGTAAIFGITLGYLSPASLDYLTGTATDVAEFFPDADFLTTEG
jgi:hypothetical protein